MILFYLLLLLLLFLYSNMQTHERNNALRLDSKENEAHPIEV